MLRNNITDQSLKFKELFEQYFPSFMTYFDDINIFSEKLFAYNYKHSLVSFNGIDEFFFKHIYDSLYPTIICPDFFKSLDFLDIGSGAGIPGLILSICFPNVFWSLLEPKRRRVVFLSGVILDLGLKNVSVIQKRFEDLIEVPKRIISRATFPLDIILPVLNKYKNFVAGLWLGKNFNNALLNGFDYKIFNYTLPEGCGERNFLVVNF
jgi:16S rRNA (guanine527-N7)-methyltransferase